MKKNYLTINIVIVLAATGLFAILLDSCDKKDNIVISKTSNQTTTASPNQNSTNYRTSQQLPQNITSMEKILPNNLEYISFKKSIDFITFKNTNIPLGFKLDETNITLLYTIKDSVVALSIPIISQVNSGVERNLAVIHDKINNKFTSFIVEKAISANGGLLSFLSILRESKLQIALDINGRPILPHLVNTPSCPSQHLGFFACIRCGFNECNQDDTCFVVCTVFAPLCAIGFAIGCLFGG